jgi:hypothetical protein
VAETADRLVRYAPAQARAMLDEGRVFTAEEMLRTLRGQFQRHVLDARAWEDGLPGLIRAGVLINHHFYIWVEFWRLSGAPRTNADDRVVQRLAVPLRALQNMRRARRALHSAAGRMARLRRTER